MLLSCICSISIVQLADLAWVIPLSYSDQAVSFFPGNASTSDVNSENKTSSEVNIVENERLNCSDDEASCKMDEISVKDESDSCLEGEEESDEMNGMEEGGNEMNKSRGEIHTRN